MKMIYILPFFLICSLSFTQCPGDANLDDIVNINDIILIINSILIEQNLENDEYTNSDINNDGTIDIIDIVLIVEIILTDEYQCEESTALDLSLDWEMQDNLSYFDSDALIDIIDNQISQLDHIHGIIVIHNGKIVAEDYYNSSIKKNFIESVNVTLDNLLPDYGQPYLEEITLKNLLTMTSGYYDSYGYPAWTFATTQQLEWMPYTYPGYFFYNNSACHLNSHALYYATGMTPKEFANINLFPYLGIENPQWLNGFNSINDGSASLELRLRDMVKLGQLYLQGGYSGPNQILSNQWIAEATSFQAITGWTDELSGYGYLWWLPPDGFLAYGYGGQYIAVLPSKSLVVGTHSSIYSTTTYQEQLREYIFNSIAPLFDEN